MNEENEGRTPLRCLRLLLLKLSPDGGADEEFLIREIREIRGPIILLAAGPALSLVLPLWDQRNTQVANAQPLATTRTFSHFSIDIHAYQLYNYLRMVRNEWTKGDRTRTGFPVQKLKLGHQHFSFLFSQFLLFVHHSVPFQVLFPPHNPYISHPPQKSGKVRGGATLPRSRGSVSQTARLEPRPTEV